MDANDTTLVTTEIPTVPRGPGHQSSTTPKPRKLFYNDEYGTGGSARPSQSEQLHTQRRSQTDIRTRVSTTTGKRYYLATCVCICKILQEKKELFNEQGLDSEYDSDE